jgi:hypothetical protein
MNFPDAMAEIHPGQRVLTRVNPRRVANEAHSNAGPACYASRSKQSDRFPMVDVKNSAAVTFLIVLEHLDTKPWFVWSWNARMALSLARGDQELELTCSTRYRRDQGRP